jgi:hypothetical protein
MNPAFRLAWLPAQVVVPNSARWITERVPGFDSTGLSVIQM